MPPIQRGSVRDNRPAGPKVQAGEVPFELETDDVTNYEVGWKADLAGGTLRINGSAFYAEIDRLQTTIFDPSIVNLFSQITLLTRK